MGCTVRPMHILFRPCGLTLNKRNDRQRSPTAIMQTNSSMRMRVRINVVGVVLSINDRRKRVSGRGLCEPFIKTNFAAGPRKFFCTSIVDIRINRVNIAPPTLLDVLVTGLKSQVVSLQTAHSWANAGVLSGDACRPLSVAG